MTSVRNPYQHTCAKRPCRHFVNHVEWSVTSEVNCPACAYERGVEYGKAHSCDHHRAFSLEEGKPLLCPTCGEEVEERANG